MGASVIASARQFCGLMRFPRARESLLVGIGANEEATDTLHDSALWYSFLSCGLSHDVSG